MKKTIAVVTGGYSGEAVISYKSAITVENNIDKEKFDVYTIDINPDGWVYKAEDGTAVAIDKNDFSVIGHLSFGFNSCYLAKPFDDSCCTKNNQHYSR